jgi:hypothetical protein
MTAHGAARALLPGPQTTPPAASQKTEATRYPEQGQIVAHPEAAPKSRVVPESDLPDEVRYLAVADDGATLLEGTVHNAVYVLPQLGLPRLLYTAGDLQGMAFAPRTDDLVAFDRAAGTAFLLQDLAGASSYVSLADGRSGLDGNVFLQTSRAGAVIASTKSTDVGNFNVRTLGAAIAQCRNWRGRRSVMPNHRTPRAVGSCPIGRRRPRSSPHPA